ncbi:hypothetical protein Vretifemale_12596 [Volvox reticuliferus]|nr:hypothetical protein Vretifemale_12596 [Volvox reticuliferus]
MKTLKKGYPSKYVADELDNHQLLRHPHIVYCEEVFIDDTSLCIVMEYANCGSLLDLVKLRRGLEEIYARWFFQQLILALHFCHNRGIAHRDIKPENLLLHIYEDLKYPVPILKMCDFGLSKAVVLPGASAKSCVGTVRYMAPEVLKNNEMDYDAMMADVWSCGVVLYVMLYGRYPFDSKGADRVISKEQKVRRMLDRMKREAYVLNPDVSVTDECMNLLRGMLKPAPDQRLTIEKIMAHPWFKKDLPKGAHEMNTDCLNEPVPPKHQKLVEIIRLLRMGCPVGRLLITNLRVGTTFGEEVPPEEGTLLGAAGREEEVRKPPEQPIKVLSTQAPSRTGRRASRQRGSQPGRPMTCMPFSSINWCESMRGAGRGRSIAFSVL